MPQVAAAARSSRQRRVVQCRDDQQHRIGAMRPRLHDLIWVDDEVFAENRNGPVAVVGDTRGGFEIAEGSLEKRLIGQHRDRRRAARDVVLCHRRRVDADRKRPA